MLVRTRPVRPGLAFRTFDRSFDRTFEQLTSSLFAGGSRTPVVDAAWRDGDLVLTVDLPGVPADQVGVSVSGRTLTLSTTSEHSAWERSLSIGAALDPENVAANHVDGRLTVTIGAAAKPEARTIEIATSAPAAIESATTDEAQPENDTSDNA